MKIIRLTLLERTVKSCLLCGSLRLRKFSTKSETKLKRTENSEKKIRSTELNRYLKTELNLSHIIKDLPKRFLKVNNKAPDDLYLIDSTVAKEIASALKPYVINTNSTIIETNPGFGFVSKELLNCGVNKLQLYEATVYFQQQLLDLNKEYPDRFKIYNKDFFSIWKLSHQDRYDNGTRVKTMLSDIEPRPWTDEPTMKIIGALATPTFLRHLITSLLSQFGIMLHGRCELFLILSPFLYLQLTASTEDGYIFYRGSSVLFQMFCDYEILTKVPRKAFLPWDNTAASKTKTKFKNYYSPDSDYMYLTRIVFKRDLPVPENRLQHLWYFVRHAMFSRKNCVIPLLEKWVPGSGLRLLLTHTEHNLQKNNNLCRNLNVYTQIGQLSASEILNLYKEFSSWPEYLECSFVPSMETALLKMEGTQDLDSQITDKQKKSTTKSISSLSENQDDDGIESGNDSHDER